MFASNPSQKVRLNSPISTNGDEKKPEILQKIQKTFRDITAKSNNTIETKQRFYETK